MSAEPNPSPSADNQQDIIQKFHAAYDDAIRDAQTQALHTDTQGWQDLYIGHRQRLKTRRIDLATQLRKCADSLDVWIGSEDDDKVIKEIVKSIADIRAQDAAFDELTVNPVKRVVTICEKIIGEYTAEADALERRAPLVHLGLVHTMQLAIATKRRAVWNHETGRIEIKTPS
jgi:hypothetical protein